MIKAVPECELHFRNGFCAVFRPNESAPVGCSVLSRSYSLYGTEDTYKVTAVGKACFLTDAVKVMVGKDKVISRLAHPQIIYELTAALAVYCLEAFGKMGIAYAAAFGKLGDLQLLGVVRIYIFCNGVNGFAVDPRGRLFQREASIHPQADNTCEQDIQSRIKNRSVTIP